MEWTRGPVIGRGSSAAVSLATTSAGRLFAVKSASMSSSNSLRNEQHLISQLCSPFVVKCFGSDVTREGGESVYNIFLEYVSGGTLSDLIRNNGGSLHEGAIGFYARQMAKGLNYLHCSGVVHCDVKGHNMLIDGDSGLKIADFGCAKCGGGDGAPAVFAGTPAYMAPEVARGEEQSFPADVWALGCTVIEMATGANPWPDMKDPAAALYRAAYSGDVPETPSWFSGAARDFVAKCLTRDPRERWTAAELLRHPFLDSAEVGGAGVRKPARKSPTSVMDQRFWDALEVSDSSTDPTENPWDSDFPAGRIRGLVGDCGFSSNLDLSAAAEEDWMTVREIEGVNWDYQQLINDDNFAVSGIDGEVMETSIEVENSLFHSNWDGISSIDISGFGYILGDSDVDHSVPISVTFQRMVVKDFLDSYQLSAAIFFVFFSLSHGFKLFFTAPFAKHGSRFFISFSG